MTFVRTCILAAACATPALAGCGGKAIIDAEGGFAGAGGGSTTSSTLTTSTTTTTIVNCNTLTEALLAAIDSATSCDPFVNQVQCNGTAFVLDQCACQLLANETNPAAVAAANAAYNTWTNAGCGPFPCGVPCQALAPGFCAGTSGGGGVCAIGFL